MFTQIICYLISLASIFSDKKNFEWRYLCFKPFKIKYYVHIVCHQRYQQLYYSKLLQTIYRIGTIQSLSIKENSN